MNKGLLVVPLLQRLFAFMQLIHVKQNLLVSFIQLQPNILQLVLLVYFVKMPQNLEILEYNCLVINYFKELILFFIRFLGGFVEDNLIVVEDFLLKKLNFVE